MGGDKQFGDIHLLWSADKSCNSWQDAYVGADRTGRSPWTILNMVQSLDGGVTSEDVFADLGSPADQEIFRTLRSLADVILVGAETVRKEDYGPPKLTAELRAQRESRGQQPLPEIAVVSASLALDPRSRLFEGGHRPVVFTSSGSNDVCADDSRTDDPPTDDARTKPGVSSSENPAASSNENSSENSPEQNTDRQSRYEALSEVAEVIVLGSSEAAESSSTLGEAVSKREVSDAGAAVDLSAVRKALGERGHKVILCEGGPTLNAQLVTQDLIDEFCISLSPALLGGNPLHLLEDAPLLNKSLTLLSVATDNALVFLRYRQ